MSTTVNSAHELQGAELARTAPTRPFLWSVRREIWENRAIYLVPLVSAFVFLLTHLLHTLYIRYRVHGAWPTDPEKQHQLLGVPYDIAAALIMGTAFIVGIFYSLDALYGERRDRSILFWKSMPVSDLTTVLAKLTVPMAILPLLSFVITLVTQWTMLLLSMALLLGSGLSVSTIWAQSSLFHDSLILLWHIVTVHGLWYAPFYGWLLFISAWAPRAPFVWAFLPPFVVFGVEKLAFNSMHFLHLLENRVMGPSTPAAPGSNVMDIMASLGPLDFFTLPGLWIGFGIAAIFLAAAVRLRRSRGPI